MGIKELLHKVKIDESGEIDSAVVNEIENYIKQLIDEKTQDKSELIAKEISEKAVTEYKEELTATYEEKFEEYKEMITEKFSDFLDTVLDEELSIPDEIKEYARKGELYADLIESFKLRIGIDEGIVNEEAHSLLHEAKEEIISLRDQLNESLRAESELKADAKGLAASLYVKDICEGLTEVQKERAYKLLEDISNKKEIDRKFSIIKESLFVHEDDDTNTNTNTKKKCDTHMEEKICVCPNCGKETTITEGACSLYNCPDCENTKLTEKDDKKSDTNKNVDESNKNTDGFNALLEMYQDKLKSNLI